MNDGLFPDQLPGVISRVRVHIGECSSRRSAEGDQALIAEEALTKKTNTLTKVTAMLCQTCEMLEDHSELEHLDDNVAEWWQKHKERDRKRKLKKKRRLRKG